MALGTRIQVFLWGIIFVTFLARVPSLVDEFHVSRFIVVSVFALWGTVLVLPRLRNLRLQMADAVFFGFYALSLISVSWADNFGEAIFTAQKYMLLALSYLLFRSIIAEDRIHRNQIFPVIVATSVLACLIVTAQILTQLSGEGLADKGVYEIIGFSGHKNLASSYFFILLGLQLFWLNEHGKKWWYILLAVWMVLLMLLLRTRAVYLAIAVAMVIWGVYLIFGNAKLRNLFLRRILPGIVLVGVLAFGAIRMTGAGEQYAKYLNPSTYLGTASATERLFVWSKTWELIEEKPITGYGAGNWKLFFPSKSVEGGYRLQEKDLIFTRVHNDFLEVWAETGVIGLLLFLLIFAFGILGALQQLRRAKLAYKTRWLAILSTTIGLLVISLFDFPKERLEHLVGLALLVALATSSDKTWVTRNQLLVGSKNYSLILTGLLVVLLAINIPISYYRFHGDQATRQILTYRNSDQYGIIKQNFEKGNSIWYNVDPMVIPLHWYQGIAYYMEGNYNEAKENFVLAYDINPYNFNVVNNLASTLVQLQEYEEAVPLYYEALKINPKFEEGMFNVAFSLFQLSDYDAAEKWINRTSGNPEKKQVFQDRIDNARRGE